MPVLVSRHAPGAPALAPRWVRVVATRMLAALDLETTELSVHLTDDAGILELNRAHRGQDRATDVLAFPLDAEGVVGSAAGPPLLLGDVVISLDTAARQARARRRTLPQEVASLLAHGLLHLAGYDHRTAAEQRRMNSVARRLVATVAAVTPARKPG